MSETKNVNTNNNSDINNKPNVFYLSLLEIEKINKQVEEETAELRKLLGL